jgi:hypothetical protein
MVFIVPASVTVPAGATSAKFTVGTALFASTTTITATYNGVNKTAILTSVDPVVVALTCNPNPVFAGNTTICTVTLNGIVPAPTPVFVLSDQPFFAPASGTVTVPAGTSGTNFSITTTLVPDQIVAHISASALATATVTTPLTINLTNRGRKWVLNNVVFKDGGTASGYFTYDAATATYLDVNIKTTPGADPNSPLGQPPANLYYYPWPNGFNPTVVDNGAHLLCSVQNVAGALSISHATWHHSNSVDSAHVELSAGLPTLLAGRFPGNRSNVAYSTYCVDNIPALCSPPPANISQEQFGMPPNVYTGTSSFYFRVIVSGTITAQ